MAMAFDIEQIKAIAEQKYAIQRDGGECKVMLKYIAPTARPAQGPRQILLRGPPRFDGKQNKI